MIFQETLIQDLYLFAEEWVTAIPILSSLEYSHIRAYLDLNHDWELDPGKMTEYVALFEAELLKDEIKEFKTEVFFETAKMFGYPD